MRTFTLLFAAAVIGCGAATAQTVATFDDLSLAHADTFYVNYSAPMSDVGFNDGLAHFPCIYDTAYGGLWQSGFAYSNMTDSVTSGYMNQYSAKTAIGHSGSANYVVAWVSNPVTYANNINLNLRGAAIGKPVNGFYITNSTYAYNSMHLGDAATGGGPGKKFGGPTGNDPDWFKLTVRGYRGGALTTDSVDFYLADFRFADNDSDYIVNTWQPVLLTSLGHVDSLQLSLSSSDNGSFGMNTPAYFCMDDFTTNETLVGVPAVADYAAKVYPNPATSELNINVPGNVLNTVTVTDAAGRLVFSGVLSAGHSTLNTATYLPGVYLLTLTGADTKATIRFTKQ